MVGLMVIGRRNFDVVVTVGGSGVAVFWLGGKLKRWSGGKPS